MGNPDRPLVRAPAGDLSRGRDRARTCAPGRQLGPDVIIRPGSVPVFTLGQAGERSPAPALIRGYTAALELAEGLGPGLARALGTAAGLMPRVTALPAPT
jgi:hypothetical protein